MQGRQVGQQDPAAASRARSGEVPRHWRRYIVAGILRVGAVVAIPLCAYLAYRSRAESTPWLVPLHAAVLAVLLVAAFWRQAGYGVQGGTLLVVTYWLAFVALYRDGYAGEAQVLLVSAVVLTVLLFGRRAGLASLLANVLLMAVMGWLWIGGAARSAAEIRASGEVWRQVWIGKMLVLTVLGGALTFAVDHLVTGLEATLAELKLHARQLEARGNLLTRKTEELEQRNALLSGRSEALRTAVGVPLDLALALEEDALLDRAAALISERFGLFHVGIFLLDPDGDWAELRAASSEGGKRMLARRHRLRVGEEGIIGFVTAPGEPRVASYVDADPVYYENPDLPETRSEIAVPMRYQGRIIIAGQLLIGLLYVGFTLVGATRATSLFLFYALLVLMTGLTLGRGAAVVVAALSAITGLCVIGFWTVWEESARSTAGPLPRWLGDTLALGWVAWLVCLATGRHKEAAGSVGRQDEAEPDRAVCTDLGTRSGDRCDRRTSQQARRLGRTVRSR